MIQITCNSKKVVKTKFSESWDYSRGSRRGRGIILDETWSSGAGIVLRDSDELSSGSVSHHLSGIASFWGFYDLYGDGIFV